jgi:hypothetical protein
MLEPRKRRAMNISLLESPETANEAKLRQEELRYLSNSMGEDRMRKLYSVAHETAKQEYFLNVDFFIVLVPTNERTAQMDPEDFYFVRRSCPTPAYNQNVFKYHVASGSLEFLWSIPRKARYWQLYANRNKYMTDPVMKSRTSFVVMMESGKLLEWVAKENGEDLTKPKAVIKVNKPAEA